MFRIGLWRYRWNRWRDSIVPIDPEFGGVILPSLLLVAIYGLVFAVAYKAGLLYGSR